MFKFKLFNSHKGSDNSIYHCFRWMYHVVFYTGCLSLRLRKDQPHLARWNIVYTITIRIALLVGFFGAISIKIGNAESAKAMFGQLSPVLRFMLVLESSFSTGTYLLVFIIMDAQKKRHMDLADKFKRLDRHMQQIFPQINWNYHKTTRKYTPLCNAVVTIYLGISLIYVFNMANCSCNFMSTIIIAASYGCLTVGPACIGFLHIGMMDFLRIRYRLCLKLFDQYYNMAHNNTAVAVGGGDNIEARVVILISSFKQYTALILDINDVFSFVCAAGVFYDFGILTSMVFLLCQKATESETSPKEYAFMLVLLILRIYKISMTTVYGYLVARERANCFHRILLCEQFFPKNAAIREALSQFLHWQRHNKYDLTIGQSIKANFMVTYMVLNGIANYVIILIQLQFQQMNIRNQLKVMDDASMVETT